MILSRPFLDWLIRHPALVVGNLFKNPTKVIGLLLGVAESEILPEHKSVLVTSEEWVAMLNVTDQKSVNGSAVGPSYLNGSLAHAPSESEELKSVDGEVKETNVIAEEKPLPRSESKPSMAAFMQEQLSSSHKNPKPETETSVNGSPTLEDCRQAPSSAGSPDLKSGPKQTEPFLLKLHRTSFEILSRDADPPKRILSAAEKSFQVWPNSVELSKPSARILLLLSSPITSGLSSFGLRD